MKSQPKQKLAISIGELRAGLLSAIAEMDLKGTDTKVTQAICIIEAGFAAAVHQKQIVPRKIFSSGMAMARAVEMN